MSRRIFNWIDTHAALFVVLGLTGLFVAGYFIYDLESKNSASQHTQLLNRAANVEKWCGAINKGRDYDRGFVGKFHLAYGLPDLPCKALIEKTLASGRRQTDITLASNPTVFEVLHHKAGPNAGLHK